MFCMHDHCHICFDSCKFGNCPDLFCGCFDPFQSVIAMFGYMTDIGTVDMVERQTIEAEGL